MDICSQIFNIFPIGFIWYSNGINNFVVVVVNIAYTIHFISFHFVFFISTYNSVVGSILSDISHLVVPG